MVRGERVVPRIPSTDLAALWRETRGAAVTAVERVGESGWFVLGEEVRQFEAELSRFWGIEHAVGCGNGMDALEIALRAVGLRAGDRVLTTPLSAFATTLAILRAGGVPVFADVDESGLVDLQRCAGILAEEPSIRFFLPVHLFGHALDVAPLEALARKTQVTIVEDCAQSIGATSRGRQTGAVGQAAATSFYPTKNLGCLGDGGAVLTRREDLAAAARSLRDYGQTAKYLHSALGLNSRLDELQAAVLRSALLPRLAGFIARRRAIAARLRDGIRNEAVALPPAPAGSDSAWHLFPVLVAAGRDRFCRHLDERGISWGLHYPRLIPEQPCMAQVAYETRSTLANAARFAAQEVSLPLHPFLSDGDVGRILEACNEWLP